MPPARRVAQKLALWARSLTESFQTLENSITWPQSSWTDTVHTVQTKGFYRINVRLAE